VLPFRLSVQEKYMEKIGESWKGQVGMKNGKCEGLDVKDVIEPLFMQKNLVTCNNFTGLLG